MVDRAVQTTLRASAILLIFAAPVPAGCQRMIVDTLWTAGRIDGPEEAIFGWIEDAGITPEGLVVVLDSRLHEIRTYARNGRLASRTGRSGSGPGEFAQPSAITVHADSVVMVADERSLRITSYAIREGALVHTRDFRTAWPPSDICALGNTLYVQSGRGLGTWLIARYGVDGEPAGGFGKPPEIPPLARVSLAPGRVACSDAQQVVVHVRDSSPVVQAFSRAGEPLWVDTLPGFNPIEVTPVDGGRGVRFNVDPDSGSDFVVSAFAFGPDDEFVVQVGRRAPGDRRGGYSFIRTFAFDAATGSLRELGRNLPLILAASGNRAVAMEQEPYPRILLLELRELP